MVVIQKPNRKIGIVDKHAIGVSLEVAAVAIDPDEYSYRAVFKEMMPKLYVMRQRGMSFAQLHRVLNQAGFPIALATVRTYYNECLLDMLDECQKYLKRMERVIDVAEKTTVEVDRTSEMQATKQAIRSAVSVEGDRRAAMSINAFTAVPSITKASGLPAPALTVQTAPPDTSAEPADSGEGAGKAETDEGTSSRGFAPPDPLMGSGARASQATPAKPANSEALSRPQTTSSALVAPVVAANAAPSRVTAATQSPPSLDATAATGSAYCLTNPTDEQIEIVANLPPDVLGDAVLEHPAIPGLMLTRNQRLYIGRLEYRSAVGVESVEKGTEMMNRREWKQAVPSSVGRTSGDFVELDTSIIGRRRKS
ncbi:hypothetical protein [Paraburkholderia sp. A3RO-2L]|uniref:hypothetical protein n=1 Tax=Paraburkholderia sp. A3RO-2L TaxID=3028376 RepID=UPI003DA8F305